MLTAFLIMLREGFEAALVVAIVYAYVRRIGRLDLVGPVWRGVAAASLLSVAVGVAVHLTVDGLTGPTRMRVFAAISLFAVVVLTWMVFWMRRQARAIKGDLQRSVDNAVSRGRDVRLAVTAVAFFAVLREGLEAALFMIATATTQDGGSVLVGALAGLALASVLGYLVVLGGRRLPMRQFFTVTGVVLIVFAAGLVSRTVMFVQSSGDLGTAMNAVYDLTRYEWLTTRSEVGRFLAAMLGWDPRPSIEQVVAYLAYFSVTTALFLRGSRGSASVPAPTTAGDARAASGTSAHTVDVRTSQAAPADGDAPSRQPVG
ncbi:MAG: FTR1 family protein [Actinomycetota bacterium]|nr:FTR1 family protein [Actinomycetota bacterium]